MSSSDRNSREGQGVTGNPANNPLWYEAVGHQFNRFNEMFADIRERLDEIDGRRNQGQPATARSQTGRAATQRPLFEPNELEAEEVRTPVR
jgi:hypothetical protein